jgi:cell volume regulation protein A
MAITFELTLIVAAALLLLSVVSSKISDRFGVPTLLVFLVIGMLAGSDGPGGIYFDDPALTQQVGIVALSIILFSGGLDTHWRAVSRTLKESLVLATLGVLLTAGVMAAFAMLALRLSWLEAFLLGAIVSSTDAAAVFSILRSRGVAIQARVRALIELESGSNDPMAIFLTIAVIQVLTGAVTSPLAFGRLFLAQAVFGLIGGLVAGKVGLFLINRLRLGYEGLYPVLTLALILGVYGATASLGGSGFLAVYVAGIVMGREDFLHKRSLVRFYDGTAWLMQITMFLTLGLLVFPSRMVSIWQPGILLALALMLAARPVAVFLGMLLSPYRLNEKLFISWVGLRGAVPIVLATFPLLAGLPQADLIFNVVFFVVLLSVLLQGTTISLAARLTGVVETALPQRSYPIQYVPSQGLEGELRESHIREGSPAVGKAIFELGLPNEYLVVLVARGETYLIPNGGLILQPGDVLLALSNEENYHAAANLLSTPRADPSPDPASRSLPPV